MKTSSPEKYLQSIKKQIEEFNDYKRGGNKMVSDVECRHSYYRDPRSIKEFWILQIQFIFGEKSDGKNREIFIMNNLRIISLAFPNTEIGEKKCKDVYKLVLLLAQEYPKNPHNFL